MNAFHTTTAKRFGRHTPLCVATAILNLYAGYDASAADVTVNASSVRSAVSSHAISMHTSVYANQWKNAALPGLIANSGVQMLRYPGGSYSDLYHWSAPSTSGGYIAAGSDFGNFARVLSQSGTVGMVTVNYGSSRTTSGGYTGGQAKEAAAWVAYANGSASNQTVIGVDANNRDWKTVGFWAGLRSAAPLQSDDGYNFLRINRASPIGITHWEVGNEIFGNGYYGTNLNWEFDQHSTATGSARVNDPALSPVAYGTNFNTFAAAMKSVDPTIKVGAVLTYAGATGAVSDPSKNWNRNVLLQAGANVDFASVHYYANNGSTPATMDTNLLATPEAQFKTVFGSIQDDITNYTGRARGAVPSHLTEVGYFGSTSSQTVSAMYAADAYATAFSEGVESAAWLEMSQGGYLNDSSPLSKGAVYYALQALSKLIGDGDTAADLVASLSTDAKLRVHATRLADGRIGLMLINQDLANNLIANIDLNDPNFVATMLRYTSNGASLTQTAMSGVYTDTFSLTLSPASINTFILTPIPEPASIATVLIPIGIGLLRRRPLANAT